MMGEYKRLTKSDQTICLGTSTCGYCDENCPVRNPLYRPLAAYEDSGLSPAEVAELAKAKAEGRLVELPCKVGESYYGICQEIHHVKGKWKTVRWVETGKVLGFNIVAELSTTEAEVKQHQRNIDEHSQYWFTGEKSKDKAETVLEKLETGGDSSAL